MNRTLVFDYFYGRQADAYTFYRIPKALFSDPYFKKLSCEAKVLYGLLLDRMSLSVKNKWFDEQGRVYILFKVEDVSEHMRCCKQTAIKLFAELDSQKGIGLIEKKRLGLGKANVIYVKNFMLREEMAEAPEPPVNTQKSKNHTFGNPKNRLQEVQVLDYKNSKTSTSGSSEIIPQEVQISDCNNTDKNNTDSNETESSNISSDRSIRDGSKESDADGAVNYYAYQDLIRENVNYSALCMAHSAEDVDGIVALMTDTVCSSRRKIVIGGEFMPAAVVRSRLLSLDYSHIEYVLGCMSRTTTKINNIKQYLLTTLFNAPVTIGHYYTAEANYDMYGCAQEAYAAD